MQKHFRVDLHVHSRHSNRPSIWAMRRINCPESYTAPEQLYATARARGMDQVTITDHNCIGGCLEIAHLPATFISVELTSYLPEDGCKLHVVALDITEDEFDDLMHLRKNVYEMTGYLREHDVVHFVAHPLYDMDGRLSSAAVERMLLLFDAIEVRNGARAERFNTLMHQVLGSLTSEVYARLRDKHAAMPWQSARWRKAMVAGSDDHSGLFVARAHTGVAGATSLATFLQGVREGVSQPLGKHGDALTLAHTIYGIAYRFYSERVRSGGSRSMPFVRLFLDRCFPDMQRMTALERGACFVRGTVRELLGRERDPGFERLLDSELRRAMKDSRLLAAVPAEDRERRIFTVASALANRMLYHYSERLCKTSLKAGVVPFLQALGTLGVIHALASPYYLAFFHQHRSKSLIRELGDSLSLPPASTRERTALFTDTLHEINGVAMTIRRLARTAQERGVGLTVLTVGDDDQPEQDGVRTFRSVGDMSLPEYPELTLRFPPILDVLDYIERHGITRIHVSTPGTMGLLGLAAAKLMDLPVAATYHTDIPQYVGRLTDDAFLENTAWNFILWFYNQMDEVLVPSHSTREQLVERGLAPEKVRPLPRWVDTDSFSPSRRDPKFWGARGLNGGPTFLYAGRVSKEKNLALLTRAFRGMVDEGLPASLAVVGDGPFRPEMEQELRGLPVHFTGYLHGEDLARAYASADIFVFPSTTDTFGNVVLEAQASGLPVIVSDQGGPRELMLPGTTGLVTRADDPDDLGQAMRTFSRDRQLCRRMGEEARRFIVTRAPAPDEVYSTILRA
ncbi:MAG: glycosyl transferase family 1 [Desulfobulbaceae bacterium A2]|nr:MAG: glycosyl transferase family 1 [Desulfobulbaceae bacterium A2]